MTYEEISSKINKVKAVVNQPREMWQDALAAIGIPSEITSRAARYGYAIFIASVLYLQLCKCEEPSPIKHRKTERAALLVISCELDRYENGVSEIF